MGVSSVCLKYSMTGDKLLQLFVYKVQKSRL